MIQSKKQYWMYSAVCSRIWLRWRCSIQHRGSVTDGSLLRPCWGLGCAAHLGTVRCISWASRYSPHQNSISSPTSAGRRGRSIAGESGMIFPEWWMDLWLHPTGGQIKRLRNRATFSFTAGLFVHGLGRVMKPYTVWWWIVCPGRKKHFDPASTLLVSVARVCVCVCVCVCLYVCACACVFVHLILMCVYMHAQT